MNFIRLLLVFLLPPVAVYMQIGVGHYFWISLILTLLGFVPGLVYSLYIMASRPPGLSRLS
ncbi:Stress induced hydrophobic peptide [Rhodopirellula islandica]|uniref:Stress induced hydrophobic peptide n=1 Tax=Rhodopirellula islandica TaxID=595434 RepID=A0A0J1EPF5_RHOIS|nr:YqaE/Pmp3 family membrane protein [Rhodopirellula islandica]KLU07359.1 Stress induced hydrophobic peptide [Rhodopirellula islandica]